MGNFKFKDVLNNKTNIEVIQTLQTPRTIIELSDETGFSRSDLSKSLITLQRFHMVDRIDGGYRITKIGNQILNKQKGLDFLSANSDYFHRHGVEDIPSWLITQIENFSGCELVQSIWASISRLNEIATNAREFIKCAFTQPPIILADTIHKQIQSGIAFQLLFGRNSKISEFNDLIIKLEMDKTKSEFEFEKRMCDDIITNVMISESGACLMLSNREGEPDMTNAIVGNDEKFIQWCKDFFEFKWNQGESFSRIKTI